MKTLKNEREHSLKKHILCGLAVLALAFGAYGIYYNIVQQPQVVDALDEDQAAENPTDKLFIQLYESTTDLGLATDAIATSDVFTDQEKAVVADIQAAYYTALANPLNVEASKAKSEVYLREAALKLSYMVEDRTYNNFRNRLTDIWYKDEAVKKPSLQLTRWVAYIRAHIFDFLAL
jgi:hypothetical protein